MLDKVNVQTNTPASIIEITNNDMESYIKKAENLVELSMQSSNKAGAFVEQSKIVLNECKNLREGLKDEIESLGDVHPTRTDNPHNVTAEQVGAYSKEEIDEKAFLTTVPDEYVTQTELENKSYLTSDDITDLATKIELINGLELKQSKLTAGNNIAIENNVVSTSFDVANIDLSNLSELGSKVIDGQWVAKQMELSKATAIGDYSFNLKEIDYLPNDNYQYEVLFCIRSTYSGTSADIRHIYFGTDIIETSLLHSINTNSRIASSSVALPLNKFFQFSIDISFTSNAVYALGYRRLGTNG